MFHLYRQYDACNCGVTCLRMIARHYGKRYGEEELARLCHPTRNGVSMLDISEAAEKIGFKTIGVKLTAEKLAECVQTPCILHWGQHHFVVCYGIKRKHGQLLFHIADPASKRLTYSQAELANCWGDCNGDTKNQGFALLLQPTDEFYEKTPEQKSSYKSMGFLFGYFASHRLEIMKILIAMGIVSGLQLAAPFLTQAMVDNGIGKRDVNIVTLILIAQLVILLSVVVVGMTRNWITLYMNTRINISLVADFLVKMMRMPLHFFDSKLVGDLTQRMRDNDRIEEFLTGSSVEVMFSIVNFIVFAAILTYYDTKLLLVFIIGNSIYIAWTQCLMNKRRDFDLKRFNQLADEQDVVLQIISGIRDIKLFGCEQQKLWEWEKLQAKIFNTKSKTLAITQIQQFGAVLFSQSTSIFITYITACKVVDSSFTIGNMMAVAYIIGQLSSPVNSFVDFLCSLQYARISIDRLSELHHSKDEKQADESSMQKMPDNHNIRFEDVWFNYNGTDRKYVLQGIDIEIPMNKVTAIVGASGCGKTTLLKMILGFYKPNKGNIYIDNVPLEKIRRKEWRALTGSVLQDGYIFSTDIAHNIALGDEDIDKEKMEKAAKAAMIDSFIRKLPMRYNTKVGMDGNGLSQGQKQRLLIARAIYKSPQILVLDEATNALDSKNEREIMENLQRFYKGRTVVIAAHRLSTIRNADNIIVINEGRIAEQGTHESLIKRKGEYYNLICNQI